MSAGGSPPEGRDDDQFDLPVWLDNSGWLRLGLPKDDPQHGGDMEQVALRPSDLLAAVAVLPKPSEQRR